MIELRLATKEEIPLCMEFINDAREHQREQGFIQWTRKSPNAGHIEHDIDHKCGYLLIDDGVPFGYFCLSFDVEHAYERIHGQWLSDSDYAVIHRLAFGKSARGKGASKVVFRLAKEICIDRGIYSIRIDTHKDNAKMQHILAREGFSFCGVVCYDVGLRNAYELIIEKTC